MSTSPPGPSRPDPHHQGSAFEETASLEGTEGLLDAAARGDDPAGDPLAALLTAAATPDPGDALAGEDAAVAEFRAAGRPAPARWRRAVRAAAATALAALALGGVAVAADHAGLHLPGHHPTPPHPTSPGTPHNPTPHSVAPPVGTDTPATGNDAETPYADRLGPQPHVSRGRARGRDQHATHTPGRAAPGTSALADFKDSDEPRTRRTAHPHPTAAPPRKDGPTVRHHSSTARHRAREEATAAPTRRVPTFSSTIAGTAATCDDRPNRDTIQRGSSMRATRAPDPCPAATTARLLPLTSADTDPQPAPIVSITTVRSTHTAFALSSSRPVQRAGEP